MSGDNDDVSAPRGVVRPPPSDAPENVDVPRMNPLPPSLEAMVYTPRQRAREPQRPWLWAALLLLAAGITAYVMR